MVENIEQLNLARFVMWVTYETGIIWTLYCLRHVAGPLACGIFDQTYSKIAKCGFLHEKLSLAPLGIIFRILENSLRHIKQTYYIGAVYSIRLLAVPFLCVLAE